MTHAQESGELKELKKVKGDCEARLLVTEERRAETRSDQKSETSIMTSGAASGRKELVVLLLLFALCLCVVHQK